MEFGPTTVTGSEIEGAPVSGRISSFFGAHEQFRKDMGLGPHRGVDIPAAQGTPLICPAPGTVRLAVWTETIGNIIAIQHEPRVISSYFHMDEPSPVMKGDEVKRGDVIGSVGATGTHVSSPTAFHLHWALAIDGAYVDPLRYIVAVPSFTLGEAAQGLVAEARMLLHFIPLLRGDAFSKEQALNAIERELTEALIAAGEV